MGRKLYPSPSAGWKVRTGPRNQIPLRNHGFSQLIKLPGPLSVFPPPAWYPAASLRSFTAAGCMVPQSHVTQPYMRDSLTHPFMQAGISIMPEN